MTEFQTEATEETFEPDIDAAIDESADDQGHADQDEGEPEDKRRLDEAESRKLALRRERSRARKAEQRADELMARLERLERERQPQDQTRQPDPFDALSKANGNPLHELDALKAIAQRMAQQQQQQARQTQVQRQEQERIQAVTRAMQGYEDDFRADTPDYDKAAEHFRNDRRAELEASGLRGQALEQRLGQELIQIVTGSIESGLDPAETVYKLAQRRGFGVDKTSSKLDTIRRANAAGSSIGKAGASPPRGRLTVEAVGKMEGKEFRDNFQKLKAQMTRQRAS